MAPRRRLGDRPSPGARSAVISDVADLLAAAGFAAHKHRNQRRKDPAASPYINHPIAVANVLARHGVTDIATLIAAILHDTVEDTETTFDELASRFGPEVQQLVAEVTDDKSLPNVERKRLQVEHAATCSPRAKLIKLGDKICNVRDVTRHPPRGWSVARRRDYLDWTEQIVRRMRGTHAGLEAEYDQLLREGREVLARAEAPTG